MLCCRQIEGLPALSPRLARARELRAGHDGADRGDDVVRSAEPAAADVHDGETAELHALDRGDDRACGVLGVEPFAPTGDRGEDAGDLFRSGALTSSSKAAPPREPPTYVPRPKRLAKRSATTARPCASLYASSMCSAASFVAG